MSKLSRITVKKSLVWLLVVFLLAGCGTSKTGEKKPTGGTSNPPPKAEKIVLKAVTAIAENASDNNGFFLVVDRINEKLAGRLEIEYLGGPEVVDSFEIGEAVRKGVIDIGVPPINFVAPLVPLADAVKLNQFDQVESRKRGTTDFLDEVFQRDMNAKYLGGLASGNPFRLYTNFKVENLNSFKGHPMRVARVYVQLVEALGGSPVMLAPGDIYSSLERKVVDGYGWSSTGLIDMGWHEVTKYRIEPGFYQGDLSAIMNLDSWNKIPADLQKEFMDVWIEAEKEVTPLVISDVEKAVKEMESVGIETITLNPDDAKKYVQMAYDEGWKAVIKANPVDGPKLQELMTKK